MNVENNQLVIAASNSVRNGWDKAFQIVASDGDDQMLMIDTGSTEFDNEEWQR